MMITLIPAKRAARLIFVLIFSFLVKHETARPHISYHALIAGITKLALLIFCQNYVQRRGKIAYWVHYMVWSPSAGIDLMSRTHCSQG